MRYNVAALLMAPTGDVRHVAVDAPMDLQADGVCTLGPIRGSLRLMRCPEGILAQGSLAVTIRTECARCLAPVDADLDLDLEEVFRPTVDLPGGPPIDCADDDASTLIDEGHVLDVREVVRQGLLLVTPAHPLCREDCRGLCPQCGADWNQGPCGCSPEPDPRWFALRSLMDEDG